MEKLYISTPTSSNIQPKKVTIDLIKAFAACYLVKDTDEQIIFESFLN